MQTGAARDVAEEMRLDPDEMLVLTLMQQLMIGRDLIAEKNATRAQTKKRFRDGFAQVATMAHWSRGDDPPAWARESAAVVADRVPSQATPPDRGETAQHRRLRRGVPGRMT